MRCKDKAERWAPWPWIIQTKGLPGSRLAFVSKGIKKQRTVSGDEWDIVSILTCRTLVAGCCWDPGEHIEQEVVQGPWSKSSQSALFLVSNKAYAMGLPSPIWHFLINKEEKENRQEERLLFSETEAAGLGLWQAESGSSQALECLGLETGSESERLSLAYVCSFASCISLLIAAFPASTLAWCRMLIRMYGLSGTSNAPGTE